MFSKFSFFLENSKSFNDGSKFQIITADAYFISIKFSLINTHISIRVHLYSAYWRTLRSMQKLHYHQRDLSGIKMEFTSKLTLV